MLENPFSIIERRLNRLEDLLVNLNNKATTEQPAQSKPDFKYIPIQKIFDAGIMSKPTFYKHLKDGKFTLYKFGNKSFVDSEFEQAFRGVKLKSGK